MRLKKSRPSAEEDLLRLVNDGYALLQEIDADYAKKVAAQAFDEDAELKAIGEKVEPWATKVVAALGEIFPTEREAHLFSRPEVPFGTIGSGHYKFWSYVRRIGYHVRGLDEIRTRALGEYTDLPITARLYVEDIDSFSKVRDVNPGTVAQRLKDGRVELSEDEVQLALEQILDVSFHRRDWGGESNDLYTANVVVNGARTATAFALKGKGCRTRELTIADCGKNGDQILRLVESPASLFIIQYVGPVSDAVIKDLGGKIEERRAVGKHCCFCVIDGQDTARLLAAYGKLPPR
jgi:hypothetical protein